MPPQYAPTDPQHATLLARFQTFLATLHHGAPSFSSGLLRGAPLGDLAGLACGTSRSPRRAEYLGGSMGGFSFRSRSCAMGWNAGTMEP